MERQRNIEKLRERERRIVEATSRLDVALDSLRIGVWEFHITTDNVFWDVRMRELYDLPDLNRNVTYSDWADRLHPDDRERAETELRKALADLTPYDTRFRIVRPDGSIRHIRVKARVRQLDGAVSFIGVNWEITDEVQRQEELARRQQEIDRNNTAKSRFLATISHEIRTPMNGVLGILDLMLHDELSPAQRQRAGIVQDSARHLLEIVNDLLDMSRLESERVKLFPAPVDIRQMSENAVALLSNINKSGRVRIESRSDANVPRLVICDPVRLRQVIMNLVSNALKYTDEGTIDVRLEYLEPDGELRVSVRDTGIGIDPADQETLFERYAQVDSEHARNRGGTGLGLAICRELIELMGGSISLTSAPGEGSEFQFTIPAADVSNARTGEAETKTDAAPAAARSDQQDLTVADARRGGRILVAEDNPVNQKVMARYLDMGGHESTFVTNGLDALAQVKTGNYDLVFMDIEMPILNGFNATKLIRKLDGPLSEIPIIPLTDTPEERSGCLHAALGLHPAVQKPVSVDSLYSALERAIGDSGYASLIAMNRSVTASPQRRA